MYVSIVQLNENVVREIIDSLLKKSNYTDSRKYCFNLEKQFLFMFR